MDNSKCKKFWTSKCKWFILTMDLHAVYMAIDTYTHNTDVNPKPKKKPFGLANNTNIWIVLTIDVR